MPPRIEKLQSLWSGYGEVLRVVDGDRRRIKKVVNPPAMSNQSLSHRRKLDSYLNEATFYRHFAADLGRAGIRVPQPDTIVDGADNEFLVIWMEDIDVQFPIAAGRSASAGLRTTHLCLEWLARFHAHFWVAGGNADHKRQLAAQGTYWYLDTRPDELEAIGADLAALRTLAPHIDAFLKGDRVHQTVVHGDPKLDNVHVSADGAAVCFYDFQYCGAGVCAKDLAKFLHTSVDGGPLCTRERELLRYYYDQLVGHLPAAAAAALDFERFSRVYDACLLDWGRFAAGWGFWGGNTDYTRQRLTSLLDAIAAHDPSASLAHNFNAMYTCEYS